MFFCIFPFRYGSTNVHNALCQAISLREPVYAFPVHCLDTLQSIGKSHVEKSQILRDCVMLKPGTNVEEFHKVLCHYPVNLLSGDFVRAEVMYSFSLFCSLFLLFFIWIYLVVWIFYEKKFSKKKRKICLIPFILVIKNSIVAWVILHWALLSIKKKYFHFRLFMQMAQKDLWKRMN